MKTVPYTTEQYITCFEYGATGEGQTYEIMFCYAKSIKEAVSKHFKKFEYKTKEQREFCKIGLSIMKADSAPARKLLSRFFNDSKQMDYAIKENAMFEFYYKFHFNFS
jgi:hypothetical protein